MYNLMDFFKPSDDRLYASELFYLLEGLPYDENNRKTVVDKVGDIVVEKSVVSGSGLDISKCEQKLIRYKNLLVFDNPLVFSLVIGSTPIFQYSPKNDVFIINDIGVVGKMMYMSENAIVSPVKLSVKGQSNNSFFVNFKEYFLTNETTVDTEDHFSFSYRDGVFEIKSGDIVLLKLTGASKTVTYPYVLFVLDNLPKHQSCYNVFACQRIERKD